MAETLPNGARVMTPGDKYALTDDIKKLALSLNLPIPVMNQAQRDGLFGIFPGGLPTGTMVIRRDQSMLVETWDGTSWKTGAPHTEWTRAGQTVPQAQTWGVGALTQDAGKTTDTDFVTHPGVDALRIRDLGNYAITFTAVAPAGVTGRSFVEIQSGGQALVRAKMDGEDRAAAVIPNYRAAAGELLVFDVYHSSASSRDYDFRIRVTRVG